MKKWGGTLDITSFNGLNKLCTSPPFHLRLEGDPFSEMRSVQNTI